MLEKNTPLPSSNTLKPSASKNPNLLFFHSILSGLKKDGHLSLHDFETQMKLSHIIKSSPLIALEKRQLQNLKNNQLITIDFLLNWLSKLYNQQVVFIDGLSANKIDQTKFMSLSFAKKNQILVVKETEKCVSIAHANPFNQKEWLTILSKSISNKEIIPVLSNPIAIENNIERFYNIASSLKKASQTKYTTHHFNLEQVLELDSKNNLSDSHIAQIVDWLIIQAIEQKASDIHIEPRRETTNIKFRIDGLLHTIHNFPTSIGLATISRIKILGKMDVSEKRRPQDGRIKTKKTNGEEIELRLSSLPTVFGEKMVLRIFDPTMIIQNMSALGFSDNNLALWKKMITEKNGIILITGPTGSGKTTTLYSSLLNLASDHINISTIEDPIEMVEPKLNQMQINPQINLSFAQGIRSLLRQDPDIIMIGEIRDLETAEMAIQASLTGHLVFSTLHTNNSVGALSRLIDLGVPPYMIKSSLIGVMSQRLIRKLCTHCKKESRITEEDWKQLSQPFRLEAPKSIYTKVGCNECRQTGYSGRIALHELLSIDNKIKPMINEKLCENTIESEAINNGFLTIKLSAIEAVKSGKSSIEEVMRVITF